nr:hypothetical protein Itr_chr04CG08210 [Ipomoea trifida]
MTIQRCYTPGVPCFNFSCIYVCVVPSLWLPQCCFHLIRSPHSYVGHLTRHFMPNIHSLLMN